MQNNEDFRDLPLYSKISALLDGSDVTLRAVIDGACSLHWGLMESREQRRRFLSMVKKILRSHGYREANGSGNWEGLQARWTRNAHKAARKGAGNYLSTEIARELFREPLVEWLEGRALTNMAEIFRDCYYLVDAENVRRHAGLARAVGTILREEGWRPTVLRKGDSTERAWKRAP